MYPLVVFLDFLGCTHKGALPVPSLMCDQTDSSTTMIVTVSWVYGAEAINWSTGDWYAPLSAARASVMGWAAGREYRIGTDLPSLCCVITRGVASAVALESLFT